MKFRITLSVAALIVLGAPGSAGASSVQFGGLDRTLNTRSEVASAYADATATQSFAALDSLSDAEAKYFVDNALTPVAMQDGVDEDPPTAITNATYHSSATAYCKFTNAIGAELWRYNSHWTWTRGGVRVFTATHNEYANHLAWFWSYSGSKYLWASGALNSEYIGRATQGTFKVSVGVGGFPFNRTMLPILDVHVHGNGHVWHQCQGA